MFGSTGILISSEAIVGHNTSNDCVRTNSAVVASLVASFRQAQQLRLTLKFSGRSRQNLRWFPLLHSELTRLPVISPFHHRFVRTGLRTSEVSNQLSHFRGVPC
jgi:hypothetical protein